MKAVHVSYPFLQSHNYCPHVDRNCVQIKKSQALELDRLRRQWFWQLEMLRAEGFPNRAKQASCLGCCQARDKGQLVWGQTFRVSLLRRELCPCLNQKYIKPHPHARGLTSTLIAIQYSFILGCTYFSPMLCATVCAMRTQKLHQLAIYLVIV